MHSSPNGPKPSLHCFYLHSFHRSHESISSVSIFRFFLLFVHCPPSAHLLFNIWCFPSFTVAGIREQKIESEKKIEVELFIFENYIKRREFVCVTWNYNFETSSFYQSGYYLNKLSRFVSLFKPSLSYVRVYNDFVQKYGSVR